MGQGDTPFCSVGAVPRQLPACKTRPPLAPSASTQVQGPHLLIPDISQIRPVAIKAYQPIKRTLPSTYSQDKAVIRGSNTGNGRESTITTAL